MKTQGQIDQTNRHYLNGAYCKKVNYDGLKYFWALEIVSFEVSIDDNF